MWTAFTDRSCFRSYDRALYECLKKGTAHEPHMLRNAFKMHTNFEKNGTMKVE